MVFRRHGGKQARGDRQRREEEEEEEEEEDFFNHYKNDIGDEWLALIIHKSGFPGLHVSEQSSSPSPSLFHEVAISLKLTQLPRG